MKQKKKKRKDERKVLTLTGLMEGLDRKDLLLNILKNLGAV
ncbi:MAG TPA: hypothetical protein VJ255_02050 [Candidatus Acidoferrum sp.]|nr:hypothetical protein [Candidatus Acidoferrum sp.]